MFSVFDMTHEIVIINYLYHQRLQDLLKGVVVMKRFGKILENLSPSLLPLSRSLSRRSLYVKKIWYLLHAFCMSLFKRTIIIWQIFLPEESFFSKYSPYAVILQPATLIRVDFAIQAFLETLRKIFSGTVCQNLFE